jgi:hypothetical protein
MSLRNWLPPWFMLRLYLLPVVAIYVVGMMAYAVWWLFVY